MYHPADSGGSSSAAIGTSAGPSPAPNAPAAKDGDVRIVRTSGSYDCGGRCVIQLHVRDGKVIHITSEEDGPDTLERPQLRGCLKCRAYRDMIDRPDRLTRPLKRVGKRGEGRFEPVSWDEALDAIARELTRIRGQYGPDAVYVNTATGNQGLISERNWMRRLLGQTGGFLTYYGSYSTGATSVATPYTYGTANTGSSRSDWVNARLIIMVGWNPADTTFGTNTSWYLKQAKLAGARIILIDPVCTNSAAALADEWIPIRPTTDSALFDAMAWVMISESLQDQAFLDRFCLGFDEAHMPAGIPAGQSYRSHILGEGPDSLAKTPAWAEAITGIPRETIVRLARDYATCRPGALIQGYASQRHANGEQSARSATVLAAMTGNVGVSGGWASGKGTPARSPSVAALPMPNPNPSRISHFTWPEAIRRGHTMGAADGVQGTDRLGSDIKLIFNLAGNVLINQQSDINAMKQLIADESKVELIVVSELFLTASASFADFVLPSDNMFERDNIGQPWQFGEEIYYLNQAVDPPGECRNGYDWIADLAGRLGPGVRERFTEGRTLEDWLRWLVAETASRNPGFPDFETFRAEGVYRWPVKPYVAFQEQIEDPENHPFPTPSGRIEIFSPRLWALQDPAQIPAVPQYVRAWEGPEDPLRQRFPLQCICPHRKSRIHTSYDNSAWMTEAEPHRLSMSPADAVARGLADGDRVRVFNERGATVIPVKVTPRIMPGVVSLPQGAWWMPDADGVDRNGSVNVLTRYQPTPLAFSNPSHTCLVEVSLEERAPAPEEPIARKPRPAAAFASARAAVAAEPIARKPRPAAAFASARAAFAVEPIASDAAPVAPEPFAGQLGFHFDQRFCTGCMACQIACKDHHDLPDGIRWRKVDEFSTGSIEERDGAVLPHVQAWWLSLSCSHCLQPSCVLACPTGAITKRASDGIVLLDRDRCIGCHKCIPACPYAAITFDTAARKAGKCDFCLDRIQAGQAPACVCACPMRVLEHGPLTGLTSRFGQGDRIAGLPDSRLTSPALVVTGHAGALADHAGAIAGPAGTLAGPAGTLAGPAGALAGHAGALAGPADAVR